MVYGTDKRTLLLNQIEKKREAQVSSIQFRRKVLEHQRQKTYQNEYDRVLNNMHIHGVPGLRAHQGHKKRLRHLKRVAQASLEGLSVTNPEERQGVHPIYKPKRQYD